MTMDSILTKTNDTDEFEDPETGTTGMTVAALIARLLTFPPTARCKVDAADLEYALPVMDFSVLRTFWCS
jgi:hypothetical protein